MILERMLSVKYVLNKVKCDIVQVLVIAAVVNLVTIEFESFLPEMPITIPTFLGTAISVLLSFKMNQSYDRWWEARKVWGAIVNDSRSLVLQMQSLLGSTHSESIKRIAYRQIAWCYSLGQSLRGLDALDGINNLLSQQDYNYISTHTNKPLALQQLNSQEIRQHKESGTLDSIGLMQLNDTCVRMVDAMGRAERINNTIFPSTYRRFLHFIIYLFIITLSIALKDIHRLFIIALLIVIAVAFFLIEKSALHLQDPFSNRPSDVPVTSIARTIDINIRQLLGEQDVPKPIEPQRFYIM
ncbi:MAG: hypothetical protein EOP56_04980 [Sphingobacteriales bacterium]|nr:MAG: hypothetical protein EOP56_04980 [Sphingobacteriales bacterium]